MAHAQHGAEAASTHDQPARVHIQASAAPDCHHMRAMPPAKADAPLALTSASDTTDGSTNCCQSADCRSGCTQHCAAAIAIARSEEHTSELQSLMRISYAVFCLNKKKTITVTYSDTITVQRHS